MNISRRCIFRENIKGATTAFPWIMANANLTDSSTNDAPLCIHSHAAVNGQCDFLRIGPTSRSWRHHTRSISRPPHSTAGAVRQKENAAHTFAYTHSVHTYRLKLTVAKRRTVRKILVHQANEILEYSNCRRLVVMQMADLWNAFCVRDEKLWWNRNIDYCRALPRLPLVFQFWTRRNLTDWSGELPRKTPPTWFLNCP